MSLNFEKMNNDGNSFLNDLSDVLGFPGEKQKAGRILKAVLHTMRDHIPVETSLHFLSQLPAFLKAAYVEEWKSGAHRRVHHVEEFLFQVVGNDNVTGTGELDTVED
ncbi:MAG TPA: DUF2267 domain-containing protein, partial [Bacteroidia bacterium]|nr:DUF2267 domain-containing protein [Bacteroidia bacterium]